MQFMPAKPPTVGHTRTSRCHSWQSRVASPLFLSYTWAQTEAPGRIRVAVRVRPESRWEQARSGDTRDVDRDRVDAVEFLADNGGVVLSDPRDRGGRLVDLSIVRQACGSIGFVEAGAYAGSGAFNSGRCFSRPSVSDRAPYQAPRLRLRSPLRRHRWWCWR